MHEMSCSAEVPARDSQVLSQRHQLCALRVRQACYTGTGIRIAMIFPLPVQAELLHVLTWKAADVNVRPFVSLWHGWHDAEL